VTTPTSTGQLARLLGTTESRISELVRRGRLADPPIVIAGRRLWMPEQIAEVAGLLGLTPPAGVSAGDRASAESEAL